MLAPSQPSGGTYGGQGFLNSGLYTAPQFGASYSVTFTQPGTYQYLCSVHATVDQNGNFVGMVGKETVVERSQAPLPNTGEAPVPGALPDTGGEQDRPVALLAGAMILMLLGLAGRRRLA